jgi:NAD-dependent dihydropyrimidine dehydrogenase PreA subunit
MGTFVQVHINLDDLTPDVASSLVQICPVDIFALQGESLVVVTDNEDECILCELCLKAAPPGQISIYKIYKDETLISTGSALDETAD